jgi:phosphohistidine phosphatase
MKTLWLLRHAKSSWSNPDLADNDRPLKRRGKLAAEKIAAVLAEQPHFPERVCCSTAVRARETWRIVAGIIGEHRPLPTVQDYGELYHASAEELRDFVAALPDAQSTAMLIGHNPGFEDFVTEVTGTTVSIPTGCLLRIDLPSDTWSDFETTETAQLYRVWRPRELE